MARYTKTEQFLIGKEICETTLTVAEAAVKYDVSFYTARNYLRMYKSMMKLRPDTKDELVGRETCSKRNG